MGIWNVGNIWVEENLLTMETWSNVKLRFGELDGGLEIYIVGTLSQLETDGLWIVRA